MKKQEFDNIEPIDFWDNEYDLSMAIFTKHDELDTASISLSKKDKQAPVHREEIINAFALGVIGVGNQDGIRFETLLHEIKNRCVEIEKIQQNHTKR